MSGYNVTPVSDLTTGKNFGSILGNNRSVYTDVGNIYNINVYGTENAEIEALKQRVDGLERLLLSKDEIIKTKGAGDGGVLLHGILPLLRLVLGLGCGRGG